MFWAVSKPEALSDAVSQAQSIAICHKLNPPPPPQKKTVYRDTVPVKDLNYKSKEDIPNRLLIGDEILQYCTTSVIGILELGMGAEEKTPVHLSLRHVALWKFSPPPHEKLLKFQQNVL